MGHGFESRRDHKINICLLQYKELERLCDGKPFCKKLFSSPSHLDAIIKYEDVYGARGSCMRTTLIGRPTTILEES